jgi:NTE family protein
MRIHAVFEGGGVKGIGLVGAVQAAEEAGVTFANVAGTSSGAIIAAFLAAGYTAKELALLIEQAPYKDFVRSRPITGIPFIDDSLRLVFRLGLHSGARIEQWLARQLAAKGVYTFGDLPEGKLRIVTSNISRGSMLVMPDDLHDYGIQAKTMSVATAVRMSCSIPLFFQPAKLRRNRHVDTIVDGGLLSNFPLWLFDQSEQGNPSPIPTIGFQFVGRHQQPHRIRGPISLMRALVSTMIDAHDARYISQANSPRTIKVPTGDVSTTDFAMSKQKSQTLYASGLTAGRHFFKSFNPQSVRGESVRRVPTSG